MTKFIILHGKDASPESNWFMWLKGKLIGQGHAVWLPQLPNADKPNAKQNNEFIFANKNFTIDSDTILVGHSSGAVQILHLLQNLPADTVIKSAVLVSAFRNNLDWDDLNGMFEEPFDFEAIKAHCKKFILVHSDNDPYVVMEQAEYLQEQLDGELLLLEGQGHFNTETDPEYKKFPDLFEIIESIK